MDSAWVGVVGSLGGVALGGLLTARVEHLKWNREQTSRWYDERRELYARFIEAAEDLKETMMRTSRDIPAGGDKRTQFWEDVTAGMNHLRHLRWEIDLIGGAGVQSAAGRLRGALREYLMAGLPEGEDDQRTEDQRRGDLLRAVEGLSAATDGFKAAARREIGLDG